MSAAQPFRLPGHIVLPEPQLRFGSNNARDVDIHPMEGLIRFGPYSHGKLSPVANPIRVGMIVPAGLEESLVHQMRELDQEHKPRERKQYLPAFPGFEKVFGVRFTRGGPASRIVLSQDLDRQIESAAASHVVLAEALTRALFALRNARDSFDIVVILLKESWSPGFRGPAGDDFDLHDYVKAYAASEGICVQFLREDSALNYHCRCSVAWRLGIALYTKAGGTVVSLDVV